MDKIQKIKGFADMYPPESSVFSFLESTARAVFSRYGYMEIRLPIVEKTQLFSRSIGQETDVVQKEMYTFDDRKGRSLTLRPEATAGILRAYIENKLYAPGKVDKFFTFGPMFRYEKPQKGRLRQFHQLDVEIVGSAEPQCDAELVLMLADYLATLGLTGLTFEINSLGCRQCRPEYKNVLTGYLENLDNFDSLCVDCKRRTTTNPLRVLDCKQPQCKELIQGIPVIEEHLCKECADSYAQIVDIFSQTNISYVKNPFLVRGLDYYVGLTFEVTSYTIGAQGSVAGGGRYDGLIQNLGGPDVPATGLALGMERLALLVDSAPCVKPDFYIAVVGDVSSTQGLLLAQKLRQAGLVGEMNFSPGSMKSRMRAAHKSGAKYCLLLGQEELEQNRITVKNLQTSEQSTVAQDKILEALK